MATDPSPNRWHRLRRIGLLLLSGLGLLLLIAALAFTQTAMFREWLRRIAVTAVDATLDAELSVGAIEGDLFGTLVARDVRLLQGGTPLASANRIRAELDFVALLTDWRVSLREVAADGLVFHLLQDERGWNVARLVPEKPPEERDTEGITVPFAIERCVVGQATVDVTLRDGRYEMHDVTLEGGLAVDAGGTTVHIDRLSFRLPEHDLQIHEAAGRLSFVHDGAIDIEDVRLRSDGTELSASIRLPATGTDVSHAKLDVQRLSAAELRHFTGLDILATDLSGSLSANGPKAHLGVEAEVMGEAGRFQLDGTLDLAAEPIGYDLALVLEHANAAALLGPPRPSTDVTGRVTVNGKGTTLADARAVFDAALDESRIVDTPLQQLTATGRIEEQRIDLEAAVTTAHGSAGARGVVYLTDETYEVQLTARQLDPALLLGTPGPRMSLNGTVDAKGRGFTLTSANASGRLELTASIIEGVTVDALRLTAALAAERVRIDSLSLASSIGTVEASGDLGLTARAQAPVGSIRYAAHVADLTALSRTFGMAPVGGQLTLTGTAAGSTDALDVDASLNAYGIAHESAQIEQLTGVVQARRLRAADATARVHLQATEAAVAGRDFTTLDLIVDAAQRERHWDMTVDAEVRENDERHHTATLAAQLSDKENRVLVRALQIDAGGQTWRAEGTPAVIQRGGRLTIEGFSLRASAGSIRVQGDAGTEGTQALEIVVDDLDVAPMASLWKLDAGGTLSARARLDGTARAPELTVRARIDAPAIGEMRYESIDVDASGSSTGATVAVRITQAPGHQLTLDASLPVHVSLSPARFATAGSLSGSLRAEDIDLAFLAPLVRPVSKVGGALNADLRLAGDPRQPDIHGTLSITGGRARFPRLGVTYEPIELSARVEGTEIVVDTFSARRKDGVLEGSGSIRLATSDVSGGVMLQMKKFPLFRNELGEGRMSGWLWLGGSTVAPIIEGQLETDRFILRIPERLPGSVRPLDPTITVIGPARPKTEPVKAAEPGTESNGTPTPGVWERTVLRVQMDVPRDAWLRRSDANVELRGWLTAWKKAAEPFRLAGEINAVRGWYQFQGKKFNVDEGKVIFTGQTLEPLLDLTAIHRTSDYTVRVKLAGTVSKPTLTLESEPFLEQADILSVLLFGKPAKDLGTGESVGLREQALGIAGGYAAGELRESVARALHLDNLEFDTGDAGLHDSRVTAGKYLTEDVFVSLAHRFGKESLQEFRAEYFFLPHWSIEGSADTLGESGVDVFWRRRY